MDKHFMLMDPSSGDLVLQTVEGISTAVETRAAQWAQWANASAAGYTNTKHNEAVAHANTKHDEAVAHTNNKYVEATANTNAKHATAMARAIHDIRSHDGRYHVVMQNDGNLVMYCGGGARWATGRKGC